MDLHGTGDDSRDEDVDTAVKVLRALGVPEALAVFIHGGRSGDEKAQHADGAEAWAIHSEAAFFGYRSSKSGFVLLPLATSEHFVSMPTKHHGVCLDCGKSHEEKEELGYCPSQQDQKQEEV